MHFNPKESNQRTVSIETNAATGERSALVPEGERLKMLPVHPSHQHLKAAAREAGERGGQARRHERLQESRLLSFGRRSHVALLTARGETQRHSLKHFSYPCESSEWCLTRVLVRQLEYSHKGSTPPPHPTPTTMKALGDSGE